jgi:hypothetical protein
MLSRYLYWFIYRRRNKFIIILFIIITIIFISYGNNNNNNPPSTSETLKSRRTRNLDEKRIRINRDTYKIPEPCHRCPGENGAGVSLSVIENIQRKSSYFNFSILLGRRIKRFR